MMTFFSSPSPMFRLRLLLPLFGFFLGTFASAEAATVRAYVQPATARPDQVS